MGQKVHPNGIRLGIVKEHTSVWYADRKNYADYLFADLKVREYLQDKLKSASVSRIDIHRPAQTARITIHTARPGIVIGKKGEDVEKLRQDLTKQMGVPVHINIEEIRKPEPPRPGFHRPVPDSWSSVQGQENVRSSGCGAGNRSIPGDRARR
ncbi:30S ribosomal protein S3, partial [Pseudomonas aeruginosa]|uniref:30S ribosomal protein S3 n=1 Tax=Pseudomonas aeruginosa TaxID=287 RepID=UPI003D154C78